jgi:protein dithiol oxidoreductase (disulfide-forming)
MIRLRMIGIVLLALTSMAAAQQKSHPKGSNQYFAIAGRGAAENSSAEVIEFFSYGCSHCADFQPAMSDLKSRLPASARLRLVPVIFNPHWEAFSRAFYAAEALGITEQSHQALFDRMRTQRTATNSLPELATQFYQQYGVDPARFIAVANSAAITRKLGEAYRLATISGVDRTPTLTINGKYRVVLNASTGVTQTRAVELALDLLDE